MSRRAWVIGAGLAGLSAAVELTRGGFAVRVIEAAAQAGGRCRSYHDPQLDRVIDNGNHLVLSGNRAVAHYLATIGAGDRLTGPAVAEYPFVHLAADGGASRWTFRPNDGPIPWWIAAADRRVPGTGFTDYLRLRGLTGGRLGETVGDRVATRGTAWDRLIEPVLLAALNTAPADVAATLAAAVVRQTLARGGVAMLPRIADPTLSAAFIDPALAWLAEHGGSVALGQRVRSLGLQDAALGDIDGTTIAADEPVVLAVPPWVAATLIPDLVVPDEFRAIVNAHFLIAPRPGAPPIVGLTGGLAEWVFAFADRMSVTVSAADRLVDIDRAELARRLWADVARVYDLPFDLPQWQIVKEKRATFAATPQQDARRPAAATRWRNLFLAGDWTQTGLPATIEGALQSGVTAARLAGRVRAL